MKKLVIITAHPDEGSLCHQNAEALEKAGRKQGFEIQRFEAFDFPLLPHSPIPHGFPDAFDAPTDALADADVVAVCCPMWNFGPPGALKNFLDGVVQAKKMFRFERSGVLSFLASLPGLGYIVPGANPVGLMKAKKVLCVWTCDGPGWYYRLFTSRNVVVSMVREVFAYCGVRKFRQLNLSMTRKRSEEEVAAWLEKLEGYRF